MSPSPSAASPTRTSPRRLLVCGRSHAIPGSPYRLTRRPSVSRSRGEITVDGTLPGVDDGRNVVLVIGRPGSTMDMSTTSDLLTQTVWTYHISPVTAMKGTIFCHFAFAK